MRKFAHVIRVQINRLVSKFSLRKMSAVLDPEDGSITIDEKLYKQMDADCHGMLKDVYCFQINDETPKYGWICNPYDTIFKGEESATRPVADVQYNTKSNTIGFMPTNPTLALMYYNWGMEDVKVRVHVTRHEANGHIYYQIEL